MSMINVLVLKYFSIQHLANILYIPLIIFAFYYIFKDKSEKIKTWALLGLSLFNIIIFTINKFVMSYKYDWFEWLNELPLQLCNLNLILIPLALITKSKLLMSYIYYVATIAAMAAIISFDSRYDGDNVLSYSVFVYFFYHSVLVATPILCVMLGLFVPDKDFIFKTILFLLCMAIVMHGFNTLLRVTGWCEKANYFYTMGAPGNPVLELLMDLIPIPLIYFLPVAPILYGYDYLIAMPFNKKSHEMRYEVIG